MSVTMGTELKFLRKTMKFMSAKMKGFECAVNSNQGPREKSPIGDHAPRPSPSHQSVPLDARCVGSLPKKSPDAVFNEIVRIVEDVCLKGRKKNVVKVVFEEPKFECSLPDQTARFIQDIKVCPSIVAPIDLQKEQCKKSAFTLKKDEIRSCRAARLKKISMGQIRKHKVNPSGPQTHRVSPCQKNAVPSPAPAIKREAPTLTVRIKKNRASALDLNGGEASKDLLNIISSFSRNIEDFRACLAGKLSNFHDSSESETLLYEILRSHVKEVGVHLDNVKSFVMKGINLEGGSASFFENLVNPARSKKVICAKNLSQRLMPRRKVLKKATAVFENPIFLKSSSDRIEGTSFDKLSEIESMKLALKRLENAVETIQTTQEVFLEKILRLETLDGTPLERHATSSHLFERLTGTERWQRVLFPTYFMTVHHDRGSSRFARVETAIRCRSVPVIRRAQRNPRKTLSAVTIDCNVEILESSKNASEKPASESYSCLTGSFNMELILDSSELTVDSNVGCDKTSATGVGPFRQKRKPFPIKKCFIL